MQPQLLLLLFLAAVVSSATYSTSKSECHYFTSEYVAILQTLAYWTVRLGHVRDYLDVTSSTRRLVSVNNSSMEDVEEMRTTLSPSGAVKRNVVVRQNYKHCGVVQYI